MEHIMEHDMDIGKIRGFIGMIPYNYLQYSEVLNEYPRPYQDSRTRMLVIAQTATLQPSANAG